MKILKKGKIFLFFYSKYSFFHDNSSCFHLIHYAHDFRSVNCHIKLILLLLRQEKNMIVYCGVTRYNFKYHNSICSLISDKPCFI